MATTIDLENAKQIRQAMTVEVELTFTENVTIRTYNVANPKKLYDSTLNNLSYSMRKLADLQDDGFPLDGEHELYDSTITPSSANGKLGARGVVDQNLSITVTGSARIISLTVKSEGVGTIECAGRTYQATGLDIIYVNATTETLVFTPKDEFSRVFVEYITPGSHFFIFNENLIRCGVNLRSNLDPDNPSWEESDIEVQAYYPYDVSDILRYIQDDWPIIYRAGYPGDMSFDRRFYLSEPAIMENNVLTLRGVDASRKMDSYVLKTGGLTRDKNTVRYNYGPDYVLDTIRTLLIDAKAFGAIGSRYYNNLGFYVDSNEYTIRPEMSLKEYVQGVNNLTMENEQSSRMSYVDAGRPTLQSGEYFTNTWVVNEEDLAEIQRVLPRNIREIKNVSGEHRFDERITAASANVSFDVHDMDFVAGGIYEINFDTYFLTAYMNYYKPVQPIVEETNPYETVKGSDGEKIIGTGLHNNFISWTPNNIVFKAEQTAKYGVISRVAAVFSGGTNSYKNNDGLPGDVIEMEPLVLGRFINKGTGTNIFSPQSLLRRNTRTTTFTFKGDPRWQPRDFLTINLRDGTTRKTRLASIEIEHEGGGTQARVTCQDTNLY